MDGIDARVVDVRRFNRLYTRRIGVLEEGYLASGHSLTEVRVMFELAHREGAAAVDLAQDLGLDAGYLSRVVRRLEHGGFLRRSVAPGDRRRSVLSLTSSGRDFFATVNQRSHDGINALLGLVPERDQVRLVEALGVAERILASPGETDEPEIGLRLHEPGDMGWVVQAHGELYAREYGWDSNFEALVAEIVAAFLRGFQLGRERCWIAERDGERVGSVFVVRHLDDVAKLRLLLVTPEGRGSGLGRRLVRECIRFARAVGYRTLTLWTNDVLVAARHIYVAEGFHLVAEEPHHSFGKDLVGQTWELRL